jgi:hypothetical protein
VKKKSSSDKSSGVIVMSENRGIAIIIITVGVMAK